MPTRLAVFCDKLLEAGWLAALIVAPLFFNVYSSRVFEPDKAALVRSLALVMSAAWLIKFFESGARAAGRAAWRDAARENPLALPALAVVAAYIVATIFSIVPAISVWGSYQRLQGAYSTLSYIAIFFIAASSLRTRAQLDRAIHTAIVVSFPIAFYGLLQHFQLDPLPWGGDTVQRVASNMGNSIFVAAYLIMIVPLTLARWMTTLARVTSDAAHPQGAKALGIAFFAALIILIALWIFDFGIGTAFALCASAAACLIAWRLKRDARAVLLAATYTLVLAAQIVAIFFTQSRGPWLGLAGGLFAFAILYALARGARKFVLGAIAVALGGVIVLAIFNLPGSPLEPLKRVPYVGRLGQIFETETGTGRVRELIWQGALKIILPHAPLWSPTTGDDAFNALRPLIGYGPEAMFVAYNPFYPPELAHLEARTASPDRSHNETFDALVMTGALGFAASNLFFLTVFYLALQWLGIIASRGERNEFIFLWLAGGILFAVVFGAWRGWHYLGVALPAGMMTGFFIFLVARAVRGSLSNQPPDVLLLVALVSAFIAHFIEIHFGIAIVSTRLYFWFFAALLVVIGAHRLVPTTPETQPRALAAARDSARARKMSRRAAPPARANNGESGLADVLAWTLITTLVLVTLASEFINNQTGTESVIEAVRHSLFNKPDLTPSGIFILFALTWLVAGIIGLSELPARNSRALNLVLFFALTFTTLVWTALLQERALTQPGDLTNTFIGLLTQYYLALLILIVVLAAILYAQAARPKALMQSFAGALALPVAILVLPAVIFSTNYASIAADIIYKSGANYDQLGAWDQSIAAYRRARDLQPTQDYYALFLGRAYLEKARTVNDAPARAALLKQSEQTLLDAQQLNPFNTDHSANLARLHRIWSTLVSDPAAKAVHNQQSADYYQVATRLSPFTAYLRNEWSQTLFQSGEFEKMRATLQDSLHIDPDFAQTHFLLGESYRAQNDPANAAENYLRALARDPNALAEFDGTPHAGALTILARPEIAPRAREAYRAELAEHPGALALYYGLAELAKRGGDMKLAQEMLERATQAAPSDYFAQLQLVNFFSENGQISSALTAMRRVLDLLPPSRSADYQRFQQFLAQLQALDRAMQAAQKTPPDLTAHRTLAALWKARGQPQFALKQYQSVLGLAANDYDARKNIALAQFALLQVDDAERDLLAVMFAAPDHEKVMWQNVLMAINDHKLRAYERALLSARAALALAGDADKTFLQMYIQKTQELLASQ